MPLRSKSNHTYGVNDVLIDLNIYHIAGFNKIAEPFLGFNRKELACGNYVPEEYSGV